MPEETARRRGVRGLLIALAASICLLAIAPGAGAELVFRKVANSSPIRFEGTPNVWCGPWGKGSRRPAIHVELNAADRLWVLLVPRSDLKEMGRRIIIPNDFNSRSPTGPFMFVGVRDPLIEVSTNEEEASGSMTISQASCEIGSEVAFRINAVLGSELFQGTRVRVSASFSGQVGERPPSPILRR